jgi:hypothetical protein
VAISGAAVRDCYLADLLGLADAWDLEPPKPEEWGELTRHLAFLRSDLAVPLIQRPRADGSSAVEARLARWHVMGLALAAAVSLWSGWWVFVAAVVASFFLFEATMWWHETATRREWRRLTAFYPFADERDWRAHQALAEQARLPVYDVNRYRAPMLRRVEIMLLYAVGLAAAAGLLILGHAFAILMWPVSLLIMATNRRPKETIIPTLTERG